jgi:hypothetical protein
MMMRQAHGMPPWSRPESEDTAPPLAMAVTSDGDMPNIKPLTRKNLARLNAQNGITDKDDDIGSAYLFEDDTDDTMKTISTTGSGFAQQAYENGILDPAASYPLPSDFDTIQHSFTQRRTSTQPSEPTHRIYSELVCTSYNESGASYLVQTDILKRYEYSDWRYRRVRDRAITQIPSQDFNHGLSNPLPDVLEGLYTKALPDHLHNNALHTKESLSFCHFAVEFKRTDGNLRQATVQAAYDGATMVCARNQALAQAAALGNSNRDALERAAKETAVFTCVSDGKVAEVYGHRSQGGQYYQNLVARESLLAYPNRGRDLIRNAQEHARCKSYELANLLGAGLKGEGEEEE